MKLLFFAWFLMVAGVSVIGFAQSDLMLLGVGASGGGVSNTIAVNWTAHGHPSGTGTSFVIGNNATQSCGTFAANQFMLAIANTYTNGGGDPSAGSFLPTITGLTQITGSTTAANWLATDVRSAVYGLITTGSESCTTGWTLSGLSVASFRDWGIINFKYTGTPPASVAAAVDCINAAGETDGATSLPSPTCTPTNSGDLLVPIWGPDGTKSPFTQNDITLLYNESPVPNPDIIPASTTGGAGGSLSTVYHLTANAGFGHTSKSVISLNK